ncbi:unnamed protein product, partial [Oppiella nova]
MWRSAVQRSQKWTRIERLERKQEDYQRLSTLPFMAFVLVSFGTHIFSKIFALLGCNGCGKTTLSRLILGVLKPTYGTIHVFGEQPGAKRSGIPGPRVGYMPQDIALYADLTIKQILFYYAMIYEMKTQLIETRIEEFMDLLDLPQKDLFISELSGGQQRLVSIAVTIIHKPWLLVLDEPTVGLDSILRARIWHYLESQCKLNELTVMITTHYIEEANSANSVAFVYRGKCLKQSSPQQLITDYQCHKLEEVYLQLSPNKIPIAIYTAEETPDLSLKFITAINDSLFDYDLHASNETAYQSVRDGHNVMSLVFGHNYSESLHNRLLYPIDVTDEELDSSQIRVYADMSNIIGYYAQHYLWQTFRDFLTTLVPDTQHNPRALSLPIDIHTNGDTDYSFSNLFIPGFLIGCAYTLTLTLSALFSINDRSNGQKERDLVTVIKHYGDVESIAQMEENCGGVYFVPAFQGLYAPHWDSNATGIILGFTQFSRKSHLIRATVESIAFQANDILSLMRSDSNGIKIDGVMSYNNALCQTLADITGQLFVRPNICDTISLGAAMMAGYQMGIWDIRTEPNS